MRTFPYSMVAFNTATSAFSTTGVGVSYSTSALEIQYTTNYAIQAVYTGGVTGSASLLASNDGTNFDTIAGSPQTFGGAGHFMWNVFLPGYRYVQAAFTATSASTGTLAFNFFSKGF